MCELGGRGIGVRLAYDSFGSESEDLLAPTEFPPELTKEGTKQELAPTRGFEVYRFAPIVETTIGEQRRATLTRWAGA